MEKAFVSAIIVAAGSSTRMGLSKSKQFIHLNGKPTIEYTIKAFENSNYINEIIIVCRKEDKKALNIIIKENNFKKVSALTSGGLSRQESVLKGVLATNKKSTHFAIHDGARPLITEEYIEKVVKKGIKTKAAALGVEVTDTIKVVDENNKIISTPNRSTLRAVQTPQVFEKNIYKNAIKLCKESKEEFTDDCAMVEKSKVIVEIVNGTTENIKLTTQTDILIAESLLNKKTENL